MAQALIDRLRDPATGDPRSSYTLVWDLHIAGMGELDGDGNVVEWRWTSAVPPAEAGVRHLDGIVKVGGYRATFDGLNGITAAGGTRVDLLFIDHPDNNAGQLCRTEATWTAVLGGTLYGDVDPPFDLPVAKGFEHFSPTGGLCHIGQEAFHYDAVDTEAQTVHVVARAVLGTLRQNHIVDANRHRAPRIYPEPIDWRDRPATLWKTVFEPDGSRHAEKLEHAAGYLVGLPSHDATKCWFTITPWMGAVERQIGDSEAVARLVPGWKVVDAEDPGRVLELVEGYPEGHGYTAEARYEPIGGAPDEMTEANAEMHIDVFDIDAPMGRNGKIRVASANVDERYFVRVRDGVNDAIQVDRNFVGLNPNVTARPPPAT